MYYGERFNSITHVVGAALAAVSGVLLIAVAARGGDPWKIVSFSLYAAMLLTLYLTSSLYHSVRGAAKDTLRKMDHCAIYLLIAGTYTPFTLVTLRGAWGWSMFGVVWALALFGIAQEIWYAKAARILSLAIYVIMGWLAIVGVKPLIAALGWDGFLWLAAGGLFYTVGIAFYATDHKLRHGHGIWHLFVLGGSICHYIAVLFYVA
ncbi:hemolysin III family protein [Massilia sp. GCM10020059]|uniref:Hemolysin III family protein n=1 Tax=Massilia agrisoli TaxID=2892444 RepID=A0ABS8IVF7_9BURK|nr:hemolysin III family protein [Massilia agrisoli]MCC6071787.1 hemolysin III family protein [Massilia agrisoli]